MFVPSRLPKVGGGRLNFFVGGTVDIANNAGAWEPFDRSWFDRSASAFRLQEVK